MKSQEESAKHVDFGSENGYTSGHSSDRIGIVLQERGKEKG